MKACERCGAGNADDATFCSSCYSPFMIVDEGSVGGAPLIEGNPVEPTRAPWETSQPVVPRREVARERGAWRVPGVLVVVALLLLLAVAVYLVFFRESTPEPVPTGETPEAIDVSLEPRQTLIENGGVIGETEDHVKFTALADYRISGEVLDMIVNYAYGESRNGFPLDLALVWGDVANSNYGEYLKPYYEDIRMDNQWLNVSINADAMPPGMLDAYAMHHLSNNHIHPATENIYNALVRLNKGQKVLLEGYLVRADSPDGRSMSSSLARDDTDAGACECFYVEKMTVEDAVYE